MAKLDSLKVGSVPAAFADLAWKHNALVTLIASMRGSKGIDIEFPDPSPPKKLSVPRTPGSLPKRDYNGKIIISANPTVIAGLGGSANQASGPSTGNVPFEIVIVGGVASFFSGTFNGVAPTNIGSTFAIPAGTQYAILTGTASDGAWVSSALSISASPPAPIGNRVGYPPNSIPVLLYVIVDQAPFRIVANTSLVAVSHEQFRVQKSMTTPDMLPYDSYYTWLVSDV